MTSWCTRAPMPGRSRSTSRALTPCASTPDGALVIATDAGEIRWKKPEVYQWKNGVRQTVAGAFALHGERVTFALGAYDRSRELVIDPTLAYGTYLGGNDNEGARGVAVDASGNIYVAGFTFSMNFPVTSGALQTAWHGGNYYGDVGGDAFVAKYTSAGALSYLTYLGGSADDAATAIAVDAQGNAYVTGFAASSNFPTTSGAVQKTFGGAGTGAYYIPFGDAFVAKLNPTGSALVYSTFLGGKDDDEGSGIAVDSAGDAYIAGATLSSNFPTASAYQSTLRRLRRQSATVQRLQRPVHHVRRCLRRQTQSRRLRPGVLHVLRRLAGRQRQLAGARQLGQCVRGRQHRLHEFPGAQWISDQVGRRCQ